MCSLKWVELIHSKCYPSVVQNLLDFHARCKKDVNTVLSNSVKIVQRCSCII